MRLFRIFLYGLVVSGIFIASCSEEQKQEIDKAAISTKQIAESSEQLLGSPAGEIIPPDIKLWIILGGALASGAANAWQKWRADEMKQTTKAIVKGIEVAEAQNNPQASTVKSNIKTAMKLTGNYDRCNKIVDKLKVT